MTIPVGFGEVRHFFVGSGVPFGAQVTYGIDDVSIGDVNDWVEDVHIAFGTAVMPSLVQNVDLIRTECKFGPDETGNTVEFSGVNGGDIVTPQSPPNLSLLVRKITSLGGRRGRGRFYLPGVAEADVDQAGNVTTGRQTTLNTALDTYLGALVTLGSPMVVLHDPGESAEPGPTLVTALITQSVAATQRRRMRR